MKYCPKDKSHKNPDYAEYCQECGTRLKEKINTNVKVCTNPACKHVNPKTAIYCSECGRKLPDHMMDFTVNTSFTCRKILVVGTDQIANDTKSAIFRVPINETIEIILDSGDRTFTYRCNTEEQDNIHVELGKLFVECLPVCRYKVTGPNLSGPIIGAGSKVLSVPTGRYEVDFELDDQSERFNVDLASNAAIATSTLKEYKKLIVRLNAPVFREKDIIWVNLDCADGSRYASMEYFFDDFEQKKIIFDKLAIGKHKITFYAEALSDVLIKNDDDEDDPNEHGMSSKFIVFSEYIDLTEDREITYVWHRLDLNTNAKEIAIEDSTHRKHRTVLRLATPGQVAIFLRKGIQYKFTYKLSDTLFKDEIVFLTNDRAIIRRLQIVTFEFSEYPACFESYFCRYGTKVHSAITMLLLEGRQRVCYGKVNRDYERAERVIEITETSKKFRFEVPTRKTTIAKWRWARKSLFVVAAIISIVCALCVLGAVYAANQFPSFPFYEKIPDGTVSLLSWAIMEMCQFLLIFLLAFIYLKAFEPNKFTLIIAAIIVLLGCIVSISNLTIDTYEETRWFMVGIPFTIYLPLWGIVYACDQIKKQKVKEYINVGIFILLFAWVVFGIAMMISSCIPVKSQMELSQMIFLTLSIISSICFIYKLALAQNDMINLHQHVSYLFSGMAILFGFLASISDTCSLPETTNRWLYTLAPLIGDGIAMLATFGLLNLNIKGYSAIDDFY